MGLTTAKASCEQSYFKTLRCKDAECQANISEADRVSSSTLDIRHVAAPILAYHVDHGRACRESKKLQSARGQSLWGTQLCSGSVAALVLLLCRACGLSID